MTNEGVVAGFLGSSEYYNNPQKGKGNNRAWLTSATQDVLARAASTDEITNALTALTPGNLGSVAAQITHSIDHYRQFVANAYQHYLGRAPDDTGLSVWVGHMQAGLTDEQLEAVFISSAEYIARQGAGAGWVQGLYVNMLGRAGTQAEVNLWLSQLQRGASPQTIAYAFATSRESQGNRIRADYQTFLGRTPTQPELDSWMSRFARGLTNEDIAAGFLASIEYFNAPAKGKSEKADWVQSAVLDELQRSPTINEFNTLEGMLQ